MDEKIFISYSRSDRDKVMKLIRLIEEKTGADCWIDLTGIESGTQFEDTIIKAIDQAEVLLFMMSDQSLSSSWIKREVYYAEGEGKDRWVPFHEQKNGRADFSSCLWLPDGRFFESCRFFGHYWSSTLNEQEPGIAWYLFLDSSGARLGDRYRFAGRSVRAVRP